MSAFEFATLSTQETNPGTDSVATTVQIEGGEPLRVFGLFFGTSGGGTETITVREATGDQNTIFVTVLNGANLEYAIINEHFIADKGLEIEFSNSMTAAFTASCSVFYSHLGT